MAFCLRWWAGRARMMGILIAHQNFGICASPASSISRGRTAEPITTYTHRRDMRPTRPLPHSIKVQCFLSIRKTVIFICDGYTARTSKFRNMRISCEQYIARPDGRANNNIYPSNIERGRSGRFHFRSKFGNCSVSAKP